MTKSKDPMFTVSDIVKRAKMALGFKADKELADYLGVDRSAQGGWLPPRLRQRITLHFEHNPAASWNRSGNRIPKKSHFLIRTPLPGLLFY